jgi:EAL domain-containing protein (putative c-di-GMP-specific phosphodiesterase class I)
VPGIGPEARHETVPSRVSNGEVSNGAVPNGTVDDRDLSVLLITRNPDWMNAVEGATRQMGHGQVAMCGARDAISRLAGMVPHYSHVLANEEDADGLFATLADMTVEIRRPDTDMLALGQIGVRRPRVRVIGSPTQQSVCDALTVTSSFSKSPLMDLSELKAALDGAMIETRYQPIIRLRDRQPVGLEALARLNHPDRGTIPPDGFIPQIEDAGLAADLTRVVSARAFADMTGPFLAHRDLHIWVNFPLDVLETPEALEVLDEQRQAQGIPADRIIVELTESRPVSDTASLKSALERLRGLSYGVAIDDVSPSVQNLDALLQLPFTCLKFDRVIVQMMANAAEARNFVHKICMLGKRRGLFMVAEGVETKALWTQALAAGIDAAQGFLASRPLPVAAVPVWWDAWINQP